MTRLPTYLLVLALVLPSTGLSQNQKQEVSPAGEHSGYISIGLLLPDLSHTDLLASAEMAIEHANAAGAYKDQEFKLIIRSVEGLWGAGSKESVSLVYEDQVRAIIGSLDGRNGHLAEQVAAKSHLSYIETYATEPTLSQAFVPWFMRLVPNDNQQASTLLDQIEREGGGSIGILSTGDYDTRYALKSLSKEVEDLTGNPPLVFQLDTLSIQESDVIAMILNSQVDHLVLPFDADYLQSLIESLRQAIPDLKIYGTLHLAMGVEKRNPGWDSYEGMYMFLPRLESTGQTILPDSRSAYVYDAISLVINAIRQVGTERVAISDYISKSVYPQGITGSISFDELGNRQNATALFQIRNGMPILIKHP